MRTRHSALLAGLLAVTALLAGCNAEGDDPASQQPVTGDQVSVVDNSFEPANLEVTTGDTVTWVWEGRAPHDVVGDGFDSGIQDDGSFEHTFEEAGTYEYECTLHPGMTGQIVVEDG